MPIPKEDIVKFLLKDILSGKRIGSQRELSETLLSKLRKNDPSYSITGKRAREIALRTPGIKVKISTRTGRIPRRCPACGGRLKKTHTKNLRGRKIILRLTCTRCSYSGRSGRWIPSRYEFTTK
jgi:hypothetical protein